jgi:hypothetical protein
LRRTEPRLRVEQDGGQILISWQGEGFTLECAETPNGSWTAITASGSSLSVPATGTVRFYRLRL